MKKIFRISLLALCLNTAIPAHAGFWSTLTTGVASLATTCVGMISSRINDTKTAATAAIASLVGTVAAYGCYRAYRSNRRAQRRAQKRKDKIAEETKRHIAALEKFERPVQKDKILRAEINYTVNLNEQISVDFVDLYKNGSWNQSCIDLTIGNKTERFFDAKKIDKILWDNSRNPFIYDGQRRKVVNQVRGFLSIPSPAKKKSEPMFSRSSSNSSLSSLGSSSSSKEIVACSINESKAVVTPRSAPSARPVVDPTVLGAESDAGLTSEKTLDYDSDDSFHSCDSNFYYDCN